MEQVKIFQGTGRECEEKINEWLTAIKDDVRISHVVQTATDGGHGAYLAISIFYKTK